jgi:hypothetical protein
MLSPEHRERMDEYTEALRDPVRAREMLETTSMSPASKFQNSNSNTFSMFSFGNDFSALAWFWYRPFHFGIV